MTVILPLLNVRNVAEILGITPRHVYRLCDRGDFPKRMRIGGAVRFDPRDIEDYLDAKKNEMSYIKYLAVKKRK